MTLSGSLRTGSRISERFNCARGKGCPKIWAAMSTHTVHGQQWAAMRGRNHRFPIFFAFPLYNIKIIVYNSNCIF